MATIKCPECGNTFPLPENIIKKVSNFVCPRCKHQWKLGKTDNAVPPQAARAPFKHTITMTRVEDNFDFYFFPGKTPKGETISREINFGRYDSSIQSDVMIQTNDLSISRRHLKILVEVIDGGYKARIANKSLEGICLVNGKSLPYDKRIEILPGMEITLGKTRFIIKDTNTNKE